MNEREIILDLAKSLWVYALSSNWIKHENGIASAEIDRGRMAMYTLLKHGLTYEQVFPDTATPLDEIYP